RLHVRESEHEVRLKRENLVDICGREGRDPRLLAAHTRGPHCIARYADDPLVFAEEIKRFDGLLGETDNAARREDSHNTILAGAKPERGLPLPAMELGRYSDARGEQNDGDARRRRLRLHYCGGRFGRLCAGEPPFRRSEEPCPPARSWRARQLDLVSHS